MRCEWYRDVFALNRYGHGCGHHRRRLYTNITLSHPMRFYTSFRRSLRHPPLGWWRSAFSSERDQPQDGTHNLRMECMRCNARAERTRPSELRSPRGRQPATRLLPVFRMSGVGAAPVCPPGRRGAYADAAEPSLQVSAAWSRPGPGSAPRGHSISPEQPRQATCHRCVRLR